MITDVKSEQPTPIYATVVEDEGWDPRMLWPDPPQSAGELAETALELPADTTVKISRTRINDDDLEKSVRSALEQGDPKSAHALYVRLREVEGHAVSYTRVREIWVRLQEDHAAEVFAGDVEGDEEVDEDPAPPVD